MKSKGSEMFASAVQSTHAIDDQLAIELKSLTRILIDSEEGLSDASQNIGNAEIAALFRSIAGERNALAIELQDLIRDQGDEAPVSGTVAGALHRTWLDLRNSISGQAALSILLEAERGENYIHGVLSNHYVKVKWAYDRVVRLRDSYSK